MYSQPLFVHALSPLHPGTGQGVGLIDLPVAREKATGLPFLPGSSLKGSLKDTFFRSVEEANSPGRQQLREKIYGTQEGTGAAQFSDARLLLLPVRSLQGTFVWTTSSLLLRRCRDDFALGRHNPPEVIPEPPDESALVASTNTVCLPLPNQNNQQAPYLVLEDLDIEAQRDDHAVQWAQWLGNKLFGNDPSAAARFGERFAVLHEDIFNFLSETATEVRARIVLKDESKTVDNLWYEECLPAETVLLSVVTATPLPGHGSLTAQDVFTQSLRSTHVQLGGKATVGHGLCRLVRGGE